MVSSGKWRYARGAACGAVARIVVLTVRVMSANGAIPVPQRVARSMAQIRLCELNAVWLVTLLAGDWA